MIKHVRGSYTEEEHQKIVEIKNKSGYSWDVSIRKAAESFEVFGEVPESYHKEME